MVFNDIEQKDKSTGVVLSYNTKLRCSAYKKVKVHQKGQELCSLKLILHLVYFQIGGWLNDKEMACTAKNYIQAQIFSYDQGIFVYHIRDQKGSIDWAELNITVVLILVGMSYF